MFRAKKKTKKERKRKKLERNWITKKKRDNASKIDNAAGCKPLRFSLYISLSLSSFFTPLSSSCSLVYF